MVSSLRRGSAFRNRWGFIIAVVFLIAVMVPRPHGVYAQEETPVPHLPILLLNGAIYAGEYDEGALPERFRVESYDSHVSSLYVLQCAGHIKETWAEDIRRIGGEIRGYLPYNALMVGMDGKAHSRLGELDFVSWHGLYQPYFKVSPALQLRLCQGGEVTALVELYSARFLAETLEALGSMPVEVMDSAVDPWCAVIALRMPVEFIADVASLPAVEWMELCTPGTLTGTAVGIPAEPGEVEILRQAAGGGERVATCDTGLGTGGIEGLPQAMAERVAYLDSMRGDDGADLNGHGTAVAGCILRAGEAAGTASVSSRLSISAYAVGYGLGLPPQPLSLYSMLDDAMSRDARVFVSGSVPEGLESLGGYGIYASQRDAFIWNNPTMTVVEAAGNEGTDNNGDGKVDSGSLLGGATAKNVLSVGGCETPGEVAGDEPSLEYAELEALFSGKFPAEPIRGDSSTGSDNGMAAFSSRGPTRDGRIKPDLVAPATGILTIASGGVVSCPGILPSAAAGYVRAYGTSMAAAGVAAELASMRRPLQGVQGVEPSSALLKAFLLNGAEDLAPGQYGERRLEVPPAPNSVQGWGRIDLDPFSRTGSWMKVVDDTEGMRLAESRVYRIEVTSGNELRVTLAWSDYPSLPQARLHLVNDLDMRVTDPEGNVHYPNGRSSRDPLNNVERVVLDISAMPGDYTVELDAWNVPVSPQPFALVAQVL